MLGCEGARTGQARAEGGAEQDVADLAGALARRVQRRGQAAVHTQHRKSSSALEDPALRQDVAGIAGAHTCCVQLCATRLRFLHDFHKAKCVIPMA